MLNDGLIKFIKYSPVKDTSRLAHVFITNQSAAINVPEALDLLTAVPEALVEPWDNIIDLMVFFINLTNPQAGFGGTDPRSTLQFFEPADAAADSDEVWGTFKEDAVEAMKSNGDWKALLDMWQGGQWKADQEQAAAMQDLLSNLKKCRSRRCRLRPRQRAR